MKEKNDRKDILKLIRSHHNLMRKSVEVLKDEDSPRNEKRKHLLRFLALLKIHAKSEEEVLYEAMLKKKDVRMHALEGKHEHDIADMLSEELDSSLRNQKWSELIEAKAKVLAELVEHHMDEEENEMFGDIKEVFDHDDLTEMGHEYLMAFKKRLENISEEKDADLIPAPRSH